jgi:ATP-dependent DNA helicase RecG
MFARFRITIRIDNPVPRGVLENTSDRVAALMKVRPTIRNVHAHQCDLQLAKIDSDALHSNVATLPGVGPKRAAALRARGIETLLDAVFHLPYRYEDLRRRDTIAELLPGMSAIVEGQLDNVTQRPMRGMRWRRMTTGFLRDGSGKRIHVVWFNLHGDGRMPVGEPLLLCGRVTSAPDKTLEMLHPDVFRLAAGSPPGVRPIYSLPREVPQRLFATITTAAFERMHAIGAIPPEMRATRQMLSPLEALKYLHQPPVDADVGALDAADTSAHRALALDEMFVFQLSLCRERARGRRRSGAALDGNARLTSELISSLPFKPTLAQLRAIEEIGTDLSRPSQMNRLLIGDVGSGKTLVAFHAALQAVESGWQVAMMAPTELLAEQHFSNFSRLCGRLGVTSALLTGKVAGAERARLLRSLNRGDIAVVFGTHALIQEGVRVPRLGLAIIDEQHRFGVFDRARLIALGSQANVMLMTATPIPRSLALTLFRNLDVSALDEMPPGRTPITTQVLSEDAISKVDSLVRVQLEQGHRAYYVLPLIDGEEEDLDSVTSMAKRLGDGPFRAFRIGVLHGRMRPADKDRVMCEFRDGAVDVLVSTTVVEVGIDVPEATIIVIAAAERYGLAQLHQLRGRVGRGAAASHCCLVLSADAGAQAINRLESLVRCANGAVVNLDLRMRGPGDLFGARQTGALPLRFAGFIRDYKLIEQAGDMAEEWLRRDPELESGDSAGARTALGRMLDFGFSLGDVG